MIAPLQNADCLFLSEENQAKVGYAALAVVRADTLVSLAGDFLAAGYHLEDVSGLVTTDGAVSVYHFAHFDIPGRATVLVVAPLESPAFPSIAHVYQCAEWHERETRDFFGFQYEGNPNFIPLLLSEDMVDVHPLLKNEGSLASLYSIFCAEGRERDVLRKADGFTLFDAPVQEDPAPAEPAAPAEEPKKAEAPAPESAKAEAPEKAVTAPQVPAGAPAAEAPAAVDPEPAAPVETVKAAPVAEKKAEPAPEPAGEAAKAAAPAAQAARPEEPTSPEPAREEAPKAETPVEAAPAKVDAKADAKPAPKKVQGSVKKGKVVKPGKKGAGNA